MEPLETRDLLAGSPVLLLPEVGRAVPEALIRSSGVSGQVQSLCRRYLHRSPTAVEAKQWGQLLKGGSTDPLEARLVGGDEYFQKRAGGKINRFLAVAARDILGYPLTADQVQQYGAMLKANKSRRPVVALLLQQRAGDGNRKATGVRPPPGGGSSDSSQTDYFKLDPTVATTADAAALFLYRGSDPVQKGVADGTIDPLRASILRGRVLDRNGNTLSGVTVTVLGHPEFGTTKTGNDGWFDMAVNGGGPLTVNYAASGFLSVQRTLDVPWQDFAIADDVVMIPLDSRVTTIDLNSAAPIQVAQGNPVTDDAGTRRATLLFSQGTQATMTLTDGSTQALASLHVRATEYTIGATGPLAMPAALPPTSGYTYCVELSADEAIAAGATSVNFDRPVVTYVDNFLSFPVGMAVPVGYYDRVLGQWVASDNGRVVKILSETGGLADIDGDGDGDADTPAELQALGVTDAERAQLAILSDPGASLWRVAVTHFTPWDCNWGVGPPDDAQPPKSPKPENPQGCGCDCPPPAGGEGAGDGAGLDYMSQSVDQEVGFPGLGFGLHNDSSRAPGRDDNRSVDIPLGPGTLPQSLKGVTLSIQVAGQRIEQSFAPTAGQTFSFTWDGKDVYGRTLQGGQKAHVEIGYVYDLVYQQPVTGTRSFGAMSGTPIQDIPPTGRTVTLSQNYDVSLGSLKEAPSLGGWDLTNHNAYDPVGQVLYMGDGTRRTILSPGTNQTISTVPGTEGFSDFVAAPDGSFYVVDNPGNRILRRSRDGSTTVIAGTGAAGFSGDGGAATQAKLDSPTSLTLAPDGSLYFFDRGNVRIRRVGTNGIITTVAGTGQYGFAGDESPATEATLSDGAVVRAAPDGSLYVSDFEGGTIRRITSDGIIHRAMGGGSPSDGGNGDFGPARDARLFLPADMAFGPDGSMFILEAASGRIRKVDTAGIITTYGGGGNPADGVGDGGPATEARFSFNLGDSVAGHLATGPDGAVYVAEPFRGLVRRISTAGIVTTVAGNRNGVDLGDGGPATGAMLRPGRLGVGPDKALYIESDGIRRVSPPLPGFDNGEILIPSGDGSVAYLFTAEGRHLKTIDALTGVTLTTFAYDSAGRLITSTDVNGNVTRIERDANGNPTAVVSPFGQRTTLELDANGYLSRITDPAGGVTQMTYKPGGLLEKFTDPRGKVSTNTYDAHGRLTKSENDAGVFTTLTKTEQEDGHTVTVQTSTGLATSFRVTELATGGIDQVVTGPDGRPTHYHTDPDGTKTMTAPDGTVTTIQYGPDPRFGMLSPVVVQYTVQTPGGLVYSYSEGRSVTLANPADVLSLRQLVATVTVNGDTSTSTFDAAAHTITKQTPEGRTTVTTLDALGRVIQVAAAGPTPVVYQYDARGRLVKATQGTRTSTLAYGPDGLLASSTDPLNQTVHDTHDAAGRVTALERSDGQVVGFTYDRAGMLTSMTPAGRPAHTFDYTDASDLETYTPPDIGPGSEATTTSYDLDRRVTRVRRPDGTTIDFAYDSSGQLQALTTAAGTTTFSYDPTTGLLTGITAPGNEDLAYGYDGSVFNSVSWSGTVAGSVTGTLDNFFRLVEEKVNGGSAVTFEYDHDGLLTKAGALSLSHDAQKGWLMGTTLDKITDAFGYDSFGGVTSYAAAFDGTDFFRRADTLDALGRITHRVETIDGVAHTFDYAYDTLGRLIEVKRDDAVTASYTYDANGNRLSVTRSGVTTSAAYDAQDRLTQYGNPTDSYTLAGELQTRTDGSGTTTYGYDAIGNLRSVALADNTQIEYVIDGENRRVGKKVNGTLVQGFLYDGQLRPVAELDGAGHIVSRFVYATGMNVPDTMIKDGVTYRLIKDQVNSVRLVVNAATGEVAQRIDYDEFGRVLNDTNAGFQPFGFAGGLYDRETGLVRFGARDYDAETGRWTVKDPLGFGGGQANLYTYVQNDPINSADPLGLAPQVYAAYTPVALGGHHIELFGYDSSTGAFFEAGGRGPGPSGALPNNGSPLWAEVTRGQLPANLSNFGDKLQHVLENVYGKDLLVRPIPIDPCLSFEEAHQRVRELADSLTRFGFDYTATPETWHNGSVNSNSAAGWLINALGGDPASLQTPTRWTPGLGLPVPRR